MSDLAEILMILLDSGLSVLGLTVSFLKIGNDPGTSPDKNAHFTPDTWYFNRKIEESKLESVTNLPPSLTLRV